MAEEVIEIDEDGKVTLLGRDTLTVEQAKQALIDETGAAAWERWLPTLDALIAAVRADHTVCNDQIKMLTEANYSLQELIKELEKK